MSHNKFQEFDIKYVMLLTREILIALGAWPRSSEKRSAPQKICKCLLICLSYILIYCSLLPGIFHWLHETRPRVRIQAITLLLYGFIASCKYLNIIIRENQIRRCLKHIEEDWKNIVGVEERNAMLESTKTGRRLIAIFAAFLYSSGMSFRIALPLSRGKIVTAQNITIRPLPYPSYLYSINIQATPLYEIMYTIQCFSGLVIVSIGTSACGLLTSFAMHACGQLKILMSLINNFGEEQWQEELNADKKLADIVERQTKIRSFLRMVEDILQNICFMEITGMTIIICVLGYCIITEWENSNAIAMCSYFIPLSCAIVNIFIYCYTGEQVIAQAEKVASTSCELGWYRLPDKQARGIVLVMIVSNSSTKIMAGKIMDLSFKTFSDVIKASMAYLNMLRSVTA